MHQPVPETIPAPLCRLKSRPVAACLAAAFAPSCAPLACVSLVPAFAATVLLLIRRESDGSVPHTAALIVLALLGMLTHPFALPFFGVVYTVTFAVVPRQRKTCVIISPLLL